MPDRDKLGQMSLNDIMRDYLADAGSESSCQQVGLVFLRRVHVKDIARNPHGVDIVLWAQICGVLHGLQPWPMLFTGPVGTGKTCAALCVLDIIAGGTIYRPLDIVREELLAAHNANVSDYDITVKGWWRRWHEAVCVVLDEIGQRPDPTPAEYDIVKRASYERTARPAIFISNLLPKQLWKVYDERVSSRLSAGTVITFEGEDRRLKGEPSHG